MQTIKKESGNDLFLDLVRERWSGFIELSGTPLLNVLMSTVLIVVVFRGVNRPAYSDYCETLKQFGVIALEIAGLFTPNCSSRRNW